MSSTTRALRCCAVGVMGAVIGLGACQAPDLAQPRQLGEPDRGTGAGHESERHPDGDPRHDGGLQPRAGPQHDSRRAAPWRPDPLPPLPARRLRGSPGIRRSRALGVGDLDDRVRELEKRAGAFASGRKPQPVLELLTTIVQGSAGRDGKWRSRLSDKVIREHLDAARRHRAILLLGIQPGRATFLDEVKAYEKWLQQPDVGLALDPEWAMKPGQVPMRVFGQTTGREVNQVTGWVGSLVVRHRLPEKVVVIHELAPNIVRDEEVIQSRKGVALIKSVDGIGSRAMKEETWRKLTTKLAEGHAGGLQALLRGGWRVRAADDACRGARTQTDRRLRPLRVDTVRLRGRWRRARRATSRPRRPMACASHPGESEPPAATLGPLGRADRLNWLAKKRRRNTSNQRRMSRGRRPGARQPGSQRASRRPRRRARHATTGTRPSRGGSPSAAGGRG